jgi:hypothetical protein
LSPFNFQEYTPVINMVFHSLNSLRQQIPVNNLNGFVTVTGTFTHNQGYGISGQPSVDLWDAIHTRDHNDLENMKNWYDCFTQFDVDTTFLEYNMIDERNLKKIIAGAPGKTVIISKQQFAPSFKLFFDDVTAPKYITDRLPTVYRIPVNRTISNDIQNDWLKENCKGEYKLIRGYSSGGSTYGFLDEKDATYYKMRFDGAES